MQRKLLYNISIEAFLCARAKIQIGAGDRARHPECAMVHSFMQQEIRFLGGII